MAAMTSQFLQLRAGIAGAALSLAMICAAGVVGVGAASAQDIRDIPQKTTTSVTGPATSTQSQPRRGVQGPPAPLETQLSDTPPDEPIVRQPTQPAPQPHQVAPLTVPERAPQRTEAPTPATPRATPPPAGAATRPVLTSPVGESIPVAADPATVAPADTGLMLPTTSAPLPDIDSAASEPVDGTIAAPPASNDTDMLPWALGGSGLLGLASLGIWALRRRKQGVATSTGYGIELGQEPYRDVLDESVAPDPVLAKAGKSAPEPAPQSSPTPVLAPAPTAPVKPTSDGRIVSRIKATVETMPPPEARAIPPAPVQPAADGRIVSRLKVSDFIDEEAVPPPPPQRRRPAAPAVRTVSVGYSTPKK